MLGQWQWGLQRGWADIRASDADRDQAAAQLREHCAAGRITIDELSERLDQVLQARTMGQLSAPLRDLPQLDARSSVPAKAALRSRHHAQATVITVLLLVWLASRTAMFAGGSAAGATLVSVLVVVFLCTRLMRRSMVPRRGR